MADRILKNIASIVGNYDDTPFDDKTTELTVKLADVTIEKTTDREVWFQGELPLIITVENQGDGEMTTLVITDTLDISKFLFKPNSLTIEIDGVPVVNPDFDYGDATGLLTVRIPSIPAGETAVITFYGTKVP